MSLGREGSSDDLLGRLLNGAYDAVLASFPAASGQAVEAAQRLVRGFRLRGGGFSASAFGFGAGGTQTEGVSTPPSARVLDGPRGPRDPQVLQPLALEEVQLLLANRYVALPLNPAQPWRAPVEDAVVERLHQLFRGDLRGMLKALADGMTALLGLTGSASGDGVAPVGMDDLLLVLRQRNQQELKDQLGPTAWERLRAWGNRDPEAIEMQTGLRTLWGVSQSAVSQTLRQLTTAAAVEALPRKGRDPIQYMLTGTARLAF
jgi:DNA-binding transcriptional ArsR family regulator